MLEVHCGGFPELETALAARLRERGPSLSEPWVFVAPSRRMADRLQAALALDAGLCLLNARFHTFFSLALEIVGRSGGAPGALVGEPLFHDALIDRLTGRRGFRGLPAAYRATIRDLIDSGVEPEAFQEHLSDLLPAADAQSLRGLLGLSRRYLDELDRLGVLPSAGLTRRATEAVLTAGALPPYAAAVYYGFYDLTGIQADFFRAVSGACPTKLYFPYRKSEAGYAFAGRFLEAGLGQGRILPLEPGPRGAAGEGEARLFSGAAAARREGTVKVVSVSGAHDEAWAAAKEALALHEEHGIPFSEIGIVARTLEPYRESLLLALRENAVPFDYPGGEPLLRHPLAKLALSLLTLRRRDFPAEEVVDIAGSPYFRRRGDWRGLVARLGIHSGWLQWKAKLPDGELKAALAELNEALDPAAPRAWEEHLAHAEGLWERHFAPDAEARPLWDSTLAALRELSVLALAAPRCSWEDFLAVLEEKLRRASVEVPGSALGVSVRAAMDSRGHSYKALVLIGLQEGLFPRLVREDPLLPDRTRRALRHPGGYWISPKLEGYDEEKLLFALLVASARERLVCVYARSDENGRAQVPSIYLRELGRACGFDLEEGPDQRLPRPPLDKLRAVEPGLLSPKELALLAAPAPEAGRALLDALGGDGEGFARGARRLKALGGRGEPDERHGVIGPPLEYLEAARRKGFSPTSLEAFSLCPFRYFAAKVLDLKEDEEPSARGELAPWLKGQLYHKALEDFHRGYWRDPARDWGALLEESMARALDEAAASELGLYPLLWEAERGRMKRHLRAAVAADLEELRRGGWRPTAFEETLSGELLGRRFQGKVDRIDSAEGGRSRIVDYKSRWPKARQALGKRVEGLKALQPPVYLELAEQAGLKPESVVFLPLEPSPGETEAPAAQLFDGKDWEAGRGSWRERFGVLLGMLEAGQFIIAPDDDRGEACRTCDFFWVCRKAHSDTRRRAEGSRLRAAFDEAHGK